MRLGLAELGELGGDLLHRAVALAELDRAGARSGPRGRGVPVAGEPVGEGLGAREFGWSALIAELADPDPAAAVSHLG